MIKRIAGVMGLTVAVVAATAWWFGAREPADGPLRLYGNVEIRDVRLGFRVPGRLASLAVEEGDRVAPGQQLANLDGEPYREALAAAEARVAAAEANLARLEAGSRPQEVARARANVREARAAAADAGIELDRQRALLARNATTQSAVDAAAARAEQAAARLESARQTLSLTEQGFRREEIDAARAERAQAQAQARQARTRLEDTRLLARAPGTVLSRVREAGAVLAQGEPVYTVSLDRPVWIRAYVDEPDLGRIAPGMTARIHTDSRAEPYRGQIGFISPQAEFTPRQVQTERLRTDLVYRLRIVVDDPDEGLRQGMPVTAEVTTAAARSAPP